MRNKLFSLNLQLFADGADGGDGGATGETTAQANAAGLPNAGGHGKPVSKQPNTIYGKGGELPDSTSQENADASKPSFDDLLKSDPDYKTAYDERMKAAINGRFKQAKALEDERAQLNPVLELLGKKYGVDVSDVSKMDLSALAKAITDDDSYYEQEAMEKGVTVEALKQLKAIERENAELRRTMQEKQRQEANQRVYAQLVEQSGAAKAKYPNFDLDTEMRNPNFARMVLQAGVPVVTAYQAIHQDEIIGGAMQYTAQATQAKLAQSIQAGATRPVENGVTSAPASVHVTDPSKLTKQQRREIRDRVNRGEQIVW